MFKRILVPVDGGARSAGIRADSRLVEAPGQRLGEVVADEAQVWEADRAGA